MLKFSLICIAVFSFVDVNGQFTSQPSNDAFPDIFSIRDLSSYQMTVIVSDLLEKSSFYVTEYYDIESARGRLDFINGTQTKTYLYFNETDEGFTAFDYSCTTSKFLNFDFVPDFLLNNQTIGWDNRNPDQPILGPSNLLRDGYQAFLDGEVVKEKLLKTTVRGITTESWTWSKGDAKTMYYFAEKVGADDKGTQVTAWRNPVRITVSLPKSESHMYDIVDFKPYVLNQQSVFAIPVSHGCKRLAQDLKTIPIFSNVNFEVNAEVVYTPIFNDTTHSYVSNIELAIDAVNSVLAFTTSPWKSDPAAKFPVAGDVIERIFDIRHNIVYQLDKSTGSCEYQHMSDGTNNLYPTIAFPDGQTLDPMNEGLILTNEHSAEDFQYLGEGVERGLPVSIFERSVSSEARNVTMTHYVLAADVTLNSKVPERNVPVRVVYIDSDLWKEDSIGIVDMNFYGFSREIRHSNFDVSSCFTENDQSRWFQITFPISDKDVKDIIPMIPYIKDNMFSLLRGMERVPISPLRIPKIKVDVDAFYIYVIGLMLERPRSMLDFKLRGAMKLPYSIDKGLMSREGCAKTCLEFSSPPCKVFSYCGAMCMINRDSIPLLRPNASCTSYEKDSVVNSMPTMDQMAKDLAKDIRAESLEINLPINIGPNMKILVLTANEFKDGIAYGLQGLSKKPDGKIEDQFSIYRSESKFDSSTSNFVKPFGGQSFAACRTLCLNSASCESISYCSFTSECSLSNNHTEEIGEEHIKADSQCVILSRNYVDNFVRLPGISIVSRATKAVQANSSEMCAKFCRTEKNFDCQSFDLCQSPDFTVCAMHASHFVNIDESLGIGHSNECAHFSRKTIYDFAVKPGYILSNNGADFLPYNFHINAEQCAQKCLRDPKCTAFNYCHDHERTAWTGLTSCRPFRVPPNLFTYRAKEGCNTYNVTKEAAALRK